MITVLAIGKKHETWITDGIKRYETRLRKPYDITWHLIPHSSLQNTSARIDESKRIIDKIKHDDFVILLDERGTNITSINLANSLETRLDQSRHIICIIGGAYGVDQTIFDRSDFIWSLSKLVLPHQLVRLVLVEQLYRAQEINRGGSYHHH